MRPDGKIVWTQYNIGRGGFNTITLNTLLHWESQSWGNVGLLIKSGLCGDRATLHTTYPLKSSLLLSILTCSVEDKCGMNTIYYSLFRLIFVPKLHHSSTQLAVIILTRNVHYSHSALYMRVLLTAGETKLFSRRGIFVHVCVQHKS